MSDMLTHAHISRVLHQLHPDFSLEKDLETWFNMALVPLYDEKLVDIDDVTSIEHLLELLPGELRKHAASEASKTLTGFLASRPARLTVQYHTERVIPPADDRLMQRQIQVDAIVEYLIAEVLELAGNSARNHHKKTVSFYHVYVAVFNDSELNEMLIGSNAFPCGFSVFWERGNYLELRESKKRLIKIRGAFPTLQSIQKRCREGLPGYRFYDRWSKDVEIVIINIAHVLTSSTTDAHVATFLAASGLDRGGSTAFHTRLATIVIELIVAFVGTTYKDVNTLQFQHLSSSLFANPDASLIRTMLCSYERTNREQ